MSLVQLRVETRVAVVCAALATLGACGGELPEDPAIATTASAVIGGEPAGACTWPSAVRVNGATSCTGTLIHPRVVTTAAHCLNGNGSSATIGFGLRGEAGSFSLTATCTAGARGETGVNSANDWGYCLLPEDERVLQIQPTPPLVGCEAERFLKAGAQAWVVGYGATRASGAGGGGKNQVQVMVNQLEKLGRGTIDVGDATVGACHGDSGGPIYMKLTDGDRDYGFRVFGSTSGPGSRVCDCTCSTTYVNIDMHVRAIEENEGIDVTPCTDADGSWDPGPDCTDMPADLPEGSGTFPGCSTAVTSDAIETCGANPNAVPDAGVMLPDAGETDAAAGGAGGSAAGAGGSAAGGSSGSAAGGAGGSAGSSPGWSAPSPAGAGAIAPPLTAGSAAAPILTGSGGSAAPQPFDPSMDGNEDASCTCSTLGAKRSPPRAPFILAAACLALAARACRRPKRARA